MKFVPVDAYHVVSDCGQYRISRAVVPHGHVYTAWHGQKQVHDARCADEAGERAAARKLCMEACEEHARERHDA